MKIISINRQKVNQPGQPAIIIWNEKREVETMVREVEILGSCKLVHRPDDRLPNGTQLYIETDAELVLSFDWNGNTKKLDGSSKDTVLLWSSSDESRIKMRDTTRS